MESNNNEPLAAFPYKPPTDEILQKYSQIFSIEKPLPSRFFKTLFDKIASGILFLTSIPILALLKIAFVIEGWIFPENKGPMFFYYNAVSAGKIIPKYKI